MCSSGGPLPARPRATPPPPLPPRSVSSILSSVQSLLCDPNVDSPANPDAARLYTADRKAYNRRVRKCAEKSLEQ